MIVRRWGRRLRVRRLVIRRAARRVTINSTLLVNPAFLYSIVWITVLFCLWTQWAVYMQPLNPRFVGLVAANIAVSWIAFAIVKVTTRFQSRSERQHVSVSAIRPDAVAALGPFCDALFAIWACGSVVNAYASGGLPLVWLLRGDYSRSYADYGVYTLTGLLAACGLCACLGYFLLQRISGTKRRMWAIVLLVAYQIAILNRGGSIWIVLELGALYLQVEGLRGWRMVRGFVAAVLVIVVFGLIGDFRSNREATSVFMQTTRTGKAVTLFRYLPSGFWWTFMYISIGAMNLNASVDIVASGVPYWSVINLFPSVIRLFVYRVFDTAYAARYPLEMVNPSFNVFTLYGGYLADFGLYGCVAITLILQVLAAHYFLRARSGDVPSLLGYCVCFQVVILSVFTDTLTSWVALFQLFLAFLFRYFARARQAAARRQLARTTLSGASIEALRPTELS